MARPCKHENQFTPLREKSVGSHTVNVSIEVVREVARRVKHADMSFDAAMRRVLKMKPKADGRGMAHGSVIRRFNLGNKARLSRRESA